MTAPERTMESAQKEAKLLRKAWDEVNSLHNESVSLHDRSIKLRSTIAQLMTIHVARTGLHPQEFVPIDHPDFEGDCDGKKEQEKGGTEG